jgi:hypothetical protein
VSLLRDSQRRRRRARDFRRKKRAANHHRGEGFPRVARSPQPARHPEVFRDDVARASTAVAAYARSESTRVPSRGQIPLHALQLG